MSIATRNCDQCGREYSRRRQSEIGRFCSTACSSASRRRDTKAKCQQCGTEFSYRAGRRGLYCSKACVAESLKRKIEHTCARCGVEFARVPTQSGKYCSKACFYAARRKDRTTTRRMLHLPGHPLASNGPLVPEYRAILFEKIGPGAHPCHHCGGRVEWLPGRKTSVGALVVDHLDRNPLNNAPANLAPSCTRCNIMNSGRTVTDGEAFRILKGGTRLRGLQRDCEYCGAAFVTWTKNPGPNKGRFCSRSCARHKKRVS